MRRGVLIWNPCAGRWRNNLRVESLAEAVRAADWTLELHPTNAPGHATELARAAGTSGVEAIFVLGGDGTLREAAAGLLHCETALAPLPGGTTNVVTRSLGIPSDPLSAARALGRGQVRLLDVGSCNDEVFLMQASAGLDAHALSQVGSGAKRRIGRTAVALAGLGAWWTYSYPRLELEAAGRSIEAGFVAACNLPLYAGGARLAPGARPDDGELDLILHCGRGRRSTLAFATALLRGNHLRRGDVERVRARSALITTSGAPYQLDGDPRRSAPVLRLELRPAALRVLCPNGPL